MKPVLIDDLSYVEGPEKQFMHKSLLLKHNCHLKIGFKITACVPYLGLNKCLAFYAVIKYKTAQMMPLTTSLVIYAIVHCE